ncbi:MAG: aldose 1-epimerase [Chitinophagaceae bacterium]
MSFTVQCKTKGDWDVVLLRDELLGTEVEIVPAAGAIMNGFQVETAEGKKNVVDGYHSMADFKLNKHNGFKSAKMSPYACRVTDATYQWNGKSFHLDKFILNGAAIHGFLYDAVFDIIHMEAGAEEACVEMKYAYDGNMAGYPFPYNCTVKYMLSAESILSVTTHISNHPGSAGSIPIVDGWHPYFTIGDKVNDWFLEIASDQMMEYDEKLIPTGKYMHRDDFFPGRIIGLRDLDNGFLLREGISPVCTLWNQATGLAVKFISVKNYPFLQLYIPNDRKSIAIENLSGAPDAFNNGIGLITLAPGEKMDFEVKIQVAAKS